MSKSSNSILDQTAKSMAEKLVVYYEAGFRDLPKEKLIYSAGEVGHVYNSLFNFAKQAFGLDSITDNNRDIHIENLYNGYKIMAIYIETGADILESQFKELDDESYTWINCLSALKNYDRINDHMAKGLPVVYLQICLHLLFKFHEMRLKAFLSSEEFDKEDTAIGSYKTIIDTYSILIEAQHAYSQAGLLNEVIKRNVTQIKLEEQEAASSREHPVGQSNRVQKEEAIKKWMPLVIAVDKLKKEGKLVSNACDIVAKKNKVVGADPKKIVSNKYYRYKILLPPP